MPVRGRSAQRRHGAQHAASPPAAALPRSDSSALCRRCCSTLDGTPPPPPRLSPFRQLCERKPCAVRAQAGACGLPLAPTARCAERVVCVRRHGAASGRGGGGRGASGRGCSEEGLVTMDTRADAARFSLRYRRLLAIVSHLVLLGQRLPSRPARRRQLPPANRTPRESTQRTRRARDLQREEGAGRAGEAGRAGGRAGRTAR